MTLTEFLLARIADDEAEARRQPKLYRREVGQAIEVTGPTYAGPERALLECDVKRRIVEAHPLATHTAIMFDDEWDGVGPDDYETTHCAPCFGYSDDLSEYTPACVTLRLLALPYADHPDYQQEWAA